MKKFLLLVMVSLCAYVNPAVIPGTIDSLFGQSGPGFSLLDFSGTNMSIDQALAMVTDSRGRILLAGSSDVNGSNDFAVARFSAAGIVDTSFGPNETGFVLLDFSGNNTSTDQARSIIIDSNLRILVGGRSNVNGSNDFAVARFSADGIVDTSFGPNGTGFVLLDFSGINTSTDEIRTIALDNQGRIVAGGRSDVNGSFDFAAARFSADGIVDTSFGPNGTGFSIFPSFSVGSSDDAKAMILDPQERILLGGDSNAQGSVDFAAARFSADGIVDTSFGPNGTGFVLLDFSGNNTSTDLANSIVLDSQSRILLGGNSNAQGSVDFAAARFNADGIVDTSFGSNGTGFSIFPSLGAGSFDQALAIVLDTQSRVLLAGLSNVNGPFNFTVTRFTKNGVIDISFGPNRTGLSIFPSFIGGSSDVATSMVVDSRGGILLAGSSDASGSNDFALARFFGEEFGSCTLALREKYCFLP